MSADLYANDYTTRSIPGAMKWYGWGGEGTAFDLTDRPHIFNYAKTQLDLDATRPVKLPVDLDSVQVPPSRLAGGALRALAAALPGAALSLGRFDRLCHAYGRSSRDVWRLRHGLIEWAPDAVAFPHDEAEIAALMAVAVEHDLKLIAFGGGSNVAGCLEPFNPVASPVVSVNLRRLNRVLSVDAVSGTARVQAGILGPDLENALQQQGFTLGHMPDSFEHSTPGGWVATRSAGMFSDGYGNAEDMVLAVRMVTPRGVVETRPVPHTSSGPDINRVVIGSEGALGIITELTFRVRRLPKLRRYGAFLFRDMQSGIEAVRQSREEGIVPVATRLNDRMKTGLSSAFRRVTPKDRIVGPLAKAWLRRRHGLDLSQVCLLINAYEGDDEQVAFTRRRIDKIYRAHGAVSVGEGPAKAMVAGKFDLPHIRDFLFGYSVITDTVESCTVWSRVPELYSSGIAVLREALSKGGRPVWVGCHLSHSYDSGCSLYFTFAFRCLLDAAGQYDPQAELQHYLSAKRAALAHFAQRGAAISHHHAIGYEHLPWLGAEATFGNTTVVEAAKAVLDPHGIMNPDRQVLGFTVEDLCRGPHRATD